MPIRVPIGLPIGADLSNHFGVSMLVSGLVLQRMLKMPSLWQHGEPQAAQLAGQGQAADIFATATPGHSNRQFDRQYNKQPISNVIIIMGVIIQ